MSEEKLIPFNVHIPKITRVQTSEIIRIRIPVRIDPDTGDEILLPEAHEMIDEVKAAYIEIFKQNADLKSRVEKLREENARLKKSEIKDCQRIRDLMATATHGVRLLVRRADEIETLREAILWTIGTLKSHHTSKPGMNRIIDVLEERLEEKGTE